MTQLDGGPCGRATVPVVALVANGSDGAGPAEQAPATGETLEALTADVTLAAPNVAAVLDNRKALLSMVARAHRTALDEIGRVNCGHQDDTMATLAALRSCRHQATGMEEATLLESLDGELAGLVGLYLGSVQEVRRAASDRIRELVDDLPEKESDVEQRLNEMRLVGGVALAGAVELGATCRYGAQRLIEAVEGIQEGQRGGGQALGEEEEAAIAEAFGQASSHCVAQMTSVTRNAVTKLQGASAGPVQAPVAGVGCAVVPFGLIALSAGATGLVAPDTLVVVVGLGVGAALVPRASASVARAALLVGCRWLEACGRRELRQAAGHVPDRGLLNCQGGER